MNGNGGKKFNEIGPALKIFTVAFFFVISSVVVSTFLAKKIEDKPPVNTGELPQPGSRPIVACPPNFASFQEVREGGGKKVSLIDGRQPMFVDGGKFVNEKVVLAKTETQTSKVACGYLFVQAGSAKGALHTYEDVVINPNGFGGHLKPDSALSVNEGGEFSQYLYALNKIEYWPTHARQIVYTADWASLFNVQDTIPFNVALNMLDQSGFIDEITLAYKCWNPATGEENRDCEIKIQSKDTTVSDSLQ